MSVTWFCGYVIVMTFLYPGVNGHMSLNFPPARAIQYDYLTNLQPTPCGVPRVPGAPKTTFIEGSSFDITWHMSFLHRGGVKVHVIEEVEGSNKPRFLANITGSAFVHASDSTLQRLKITLPENLTCESCTLRLTKDAAEYGFPYYFYSCADITIKTPKQAGGTGTILKSGINQGSKSCYDGKCLNGGICNITTGNCQCNRLYKGPRCQEYDECWTDEDCSYHGQCIDTRATTFPRLLCYCSVGWYGKNCDKVSQVTEIRNDYDTNPNFAKKEISTGRVYLYWRYVKRNTEVEMILKVKSTSWIGVGWKPRDTKQSCRNTDQVHFIQERINRAQKESFVRSLLRTTTKPSPHVDPELAQENEQVANSRGIGVRCPSHKQKRSTGSMTYPDWFQDLIKEPGKLSSDFQNRLPLWFLEYIQQPVSKRKTSSLPAWFQQYLGNVPENAERINKYSNQFLVYGGMACADIVVGSVKGNLYRVNDLYAVDISAPLPDRFYGGKDDITSAIGSQVDGFTTIVFRKRRKAQHYSDHTIADNVPMHVIWAHGQEVRSYLSYPYGALAECGNSVPRFYRHDEFKFHGPNKGRAFFTFTRPKSTPVLPTVPPTQTTSNSCATESGSFKSPKNCYFDSDNFNCRFYIKWMLKNNMITFTVKTRQGNDDYWGISISSKPHTPPFDVYTGQITAQQQVVVTNRWAAGYSLPQSDTVQNIFNASGNYTKGVATIKFSRLGVSRSSSDLSFIDKCRYLQFVQGRVVAGKITNYIYRQSIGNDKICIKPCQTTREPSNCEKHTESLKRFMAQYPQYRRSVGLPQCSPFDGSYLPKQCMDSIRSCWCVNTNTGVPVPNTRHSLDPLPGTPQTKC